MPPLRRTAAVGLLSTAFALAGCSDGRPKTAPVRGRVTYDGKPVGNGTVGFIPDGSTMATGELGPDGSFVLTTFKKGDGAVLGRHKVVITAFKGGDEFVEASAKLAPPLVPEKYMNMLTSGLTAEVKDGDNSIDFALPAEIKKK